MSTESTVITSPEAVEEESPHPNNVIANRVRKVPKRKKTGRCAVEFGPIFIMIKSASR